MNKTFLVAIREFRQQVRTRGFLLSSLGMPVLLMIIWTLAGAFGDQTSELPFEKLTRADHPVEPVGYVDQAHLVRFVPAVVSADAFVAYPDAEAAEAALERGEIVGYYLIPPDYRETGTIRRVSRHFPTAPADVRWFEWVLLSNLLPHATPDEIARWRWPFHSASLEFVPLNERGDAGANGRNTLWLPFLVAAAVMIPLFTSGGYLLQSLAQEKSSRIMEILLVSLRPSQLLTGKLLGLGALTGVQYLCWGMITLLGLLFMEGPKAELVSSVNLSVEELFLVVPFALGGFVLYATLMAGIGALAPDIESSRAWVFFITLPMLVPIYLWLSIVTSPNGTLAILLGLIPFSAPVAMLMRMASTSVPAWQVSLSLMLLALTGVGMVHIVARLFRAQTLLSGEALSLRRLWMALQG